VRKLASIAVTAGLLVTLSACSGTPFLGGGCTPTYEAGGNSALVTADGGLGKDPEAEFPTPLIADDDEAEVVHEGDGDLVPVGGTADVQITIYDAASGDKLISTDYEGSGLRTAAIAGQPAFGALAQCTTVGSRVVAVGTAGELLGDSAIANNGLPVDGEDTVVMVADVLRSFLGKANGADQLPQAGFPAIVLAPDGRPGFTFPSDTAPTDLRYATLKAGNGAKVEEGDAVVLNYTGVVWDTQAVFESTWENGVPVTAIAQDATQASDGSGVLPGFAEAIIGAKVGSQVIVVIPPEFGYPAGSAPAAVGENATLVYVIDILGIE
jgi:peptidylprolyl isomerase